MQQIVAAVVVLLFITFTFITLVYLDNTNSETEGIKQALNLSAKAVACAIDGSKSNYDEMAKGMDRSELSEIAIDNDKLLSEFYDVLYKNILNNESFERIKAGIPAKVVVYYDRFYIAGNDDKWSPPFYFTHYSGGKLLYLFTKSDIAYYYDNSGIKVFTNIHAENISREQKNDIIINKVNSAIFQYTFDSVTGKGLTVQIRNPENNEAEYKVRHSYFNVLDGITFFVLYKENTGIGVDTREFEYANYNVVGYTVE